MRHIDFRSVSGLSLGARLWGCELFACIDTDTRTQQQQRFMHTHTRIHRHSYRYNAVAAAVVAPLFTARSDPGSDSGLCRCLFRSFARWLVRCGPLLLLAVRWLRLSVGSLERDTRTVARAIAIQAKCFKLVEIHAALHPISFSGFHMQFMV